MATIELQNLLLPKENTQIKIKLKIDDADQHHKYSTKFLTINSGNVSIPIDIPENVKRFICVSVYLLYDYGAYLYTFIIVPNHHQNTINIEYGINRPVVRINNVKAYRVDQLHRYGFYRMFCCCGSIEAALDDLEYAENDYEYGCIIS